MLFKGSTFAAFSGKPLCAIVIKNFLQNSLHIAKHFVSLPDKRNLMDKLFDIVFLEEAFKFLSNLDTSNLDKKHYEKILFNIRKSQVEQDPELFSKLQDEIWEFRTLYQGLKYRLLSFWDKTDSDNTLVVSTHGFIKKRSKVPESEIQKAKQIRKKYFEDKEKSKHKRK